MPLVLSRIHSFCAKLSKSQSALLPPTAQNYIGNVIVFLRFLTNISVQHGRCVLDYFHSFCYYNRVLHNTRLFMKLEKIKNLYEISLSRRSLVYITFDISLNMFTEFAEFSDKKICYQKSFNLWSLIKETMMLPQCQ